MDNVALVQWGQRACWRWRRLRMNERSKNMQSVGEQVVVVADQPEIELAPGVRARLVSGAGGMLSFVRIDAGGVVPEHEHPHEQLGTVLEGRMFLQIGAETHLLGPGQAYVIPSHARHSAWTAPESACLALDVFTPPREDYLAR